MLYKHIHTYEHTVVPIIYVCVGNRRFRILCAGAVIIIPMRAAICDSIQRAPNSRIRKALFYTQPYTGKVCIPCDRFSKVFKSISRNVFVNIPQTWIRTEYEPKKEEKSSSSKDMERFYYVLLYIYCTINTVHLLHANTKCWWWLVQPLLQTVTQMVQTQNQKHAEKTNSGKLYLQLFTIQGQDSSWGPFSQCTYKHTLTQAEFYVVMYLCNRILCVPFCSFDFACIKRFRCNAVWLLLLVVLFCSRELLSRSGCWLFLCV